MFILSGNHINNFQKSNQQSTLVNLIFPLLSPIRNQIILLPNSFHAKSSLKIFTFNFTQLDLLIIKLIFITFS